MKTISKEIKRNIGKELACVNVTLTLIIMGVALALGILFAIDGTDGDAWEEICTPVWALPTVIFIIFFAIALCLLSFSLSLTFFSPFHLCGKSSGTAAALYGCVYALTYIWIPLNFRATAFFGSALVCCVSLILLSALYPLVRRVGRLTALCLLLSAFWQGYLLIFSFALSVIN